MVDTGCSVTLVSQTIVTNSLISLCKRVCLRTLGGKVIDLNKMVVLKSVLTEGGLEIGPMSAYVTDYLPSGVDIILGLDII